MSKKYKDIYNVPWHVRIYVKKELEDFEKNKQRFKMLNDGTRELLIIKKRLDAIESIYNRLDDTDKITADLIFNKKIKRAGLKERGISQDVYYYTMKKVIYYAAHELELI